MEFEWDAEKAEQNLKKHGVSFEEAELVFYDPSRIETEDGRENYGEDRPVCRLHRSTRRNHPPYLCEESQCLRKKAIP